MKLNPLSPVLGAEILGLDLRQPCESSTIDELQELLAEHQLLVFRDQQLEPQQQVTFCRHFGTLEADASHSGSAEPTVVSNVVRDGKQMGFLPPEFLVWHSDLCYLPNTAKATFLYAHTIPERNGETWFADQFRAYEELPAGLKEKVEGRRAVFSFNRNLLERMRQRGWDLPSIELSEKNFTPDVLHPVIRTHPVNGRKSIFVNWAHTDSIEGYSVEESRVLLEPIFEHSTSDRFIYRHYYRPGDLIVWDNASVLHSAAPKHPVGDRIMHRLVVLGSTPFYGSPSSPS